MAPVASRPLGCHTRVRRAITAGLFAWRRRQLVLAQGRGFAGVSGEEFHCRVLHAYPRPNQGRDERIAKAQRARPWLNSLGAKVAVVASTRRGGVLFQPVFRVRQSI